MYSHIRANPAVERHEVVTERHEPRANPGVNPSIHRRVCFLLVPEFSMLAFSAALEPLRMANRLADRQLYSWEILSGDHGARTRE